ncbi:gastrokine-3-like [Lemur catta]|uniref:gastrokine-3-like n=1 Tax=Lemur catta TaxID=9447 RepID=UPI001E269CBC|nr:gastrokine-3-like [Lemur catta]
MTLTSCPSTHTNVPRRSSLLLKPLSFPFNPSDPILETITCLFPFSPSLTNSHDAPGELDELEKPGVMGTVQKCDEDDDACQKAPVGPEFHLPGRFVNGVLLIRHVLALVITVMAVPAHKDLFTSHVCLGASGGIGVASFILVIFLNLSLALMRPSDSHHLEGSVGTQSIHVDVPRGIVSVRDNNVWSEWYGILDYEKSLLVAKLFSKRACVLAKMDQAVFPSLDDMSKALKKQDFTPYPPTHGLTYIVVPSHIKNLAQYGMPVKDMCRDVPTYFAKQQKEGTALAIDPDSCFEAQLLSFMGLSICGKILGL